MQFQFNRTWVGVVDCRYAQNSKLSSKMSVKNDMALPSEVLLDSGWRAYLNAEPSG